MRQGSRIDEIIFEEFKGTGNNEIILDRRLADKRLFPAINIKKSGTRREDLLLPSDEAARIWLMRNAVNDMDDQEMTPFLIDKIRKTKDNESFLRSINAPVFAQIRRHTRNQEQIERNLSTAYSQPEHISLEEPK